MIKLKGCYSLHREERMRRMESHLLFFDIDGTLRDENTGEISPKTQKSIEQAREQGHLCFVNTGRSFSELDPEVVEVGFDGVVCGCGTYIYYNGETILKEEIAGKKAEWIIEQITKNKIQALLEGEKHFYISRDTDNEKLLLVKKYFGDEVNKRCCFWEDEKPKFQKLSIWLGSDSNFASFYEALQEEFDFIKRSDDFYEVIPKGYSKASGIAYLADKLHVEKKNTVALGDSANDLSMLTYAGVGVAMGNSASQVKKKVDFVTKSVEEEGVWYALQQLGFLGMEEQAYE